MPGDLVSGFGSNGKVIVSYGDLDACNDILIDTNNRIYFGGASTILGSPNNTDFVLGRLTASGQLDVTFGVNGFYAGDFPKSNASTIHEIRMVEDGIILLGSGVNYGVADTQYIFVSKVDFSGQLDTSFADSGTFAGAFITTYNFAGSIAIQDNGKIVVCGAAYDSLMVQDVPIIGRLNANGTLDENFSSTGFKYWDMTGPLQDVPNIFSSIPEHGAGGFFDDVIILENGNYFFSGFYNSGTTIHCLMVMIDSSGNFVSSFGSGGNVIFQHTPSFENKIVKAVKFNDRILLGIYLDNLTVNQDFIVQEVDTNGVFTNLFDLDFYNQRDEIRDLCVLDGSFFLSGYSTLPGNIQNGYDSDFFTLAKYDSVNTLAPTFASSGLFSDHFSTNDETGSRCIAGRNNRIVIGGYLNNVTGNNITDFGFILVHDGISAGYFEPIRNKMKVSPNPAYSMVTIRSDEPINSVGIYNSFGVMMLSSSYDVDRIDISAFPSGMYFIRAETTTGNQMVKKLIVQH